MRTVVFTSDNHSWLLKGFFHQWQKYGGGREVEVAGFTPPTCLPQGVKFHSIGRFEDYPVEKWSDGIIKFLQSIDDEYILFLLEDYWMMRRVHWEEIDIALETMIMHPNIVRFDVASDRMFSKGAMYVGTHQGFESSIDLCSCKGAYSISFQASIYRREKLLEVMFPGETPWQAEINGSGRLNTNFLGYKVFGSYNWPMNYMIVMNKGQLDMDGRWMYPARSLSVADWQELEAAGCLEPEAIHE
ncbi:MAG: hypothetical protein WCC12_00355 [Anaerolineales bacterium]